MNRNEIKWGCIQPLTGGMYLGAEKAIGTPAKWIISYPGLTDLSKNKQGDVIDAGNEANIYEYLKSHNRLPDYYRMNRTMTQNDEDLTPVLTHDNGTVYEGVSANDVYAGVDLVVGVPVCAGLSMASTANAARKDECNCQMIWMAKYALNTVKPKVYIFENAPTLMSERGDSVRDQLETIAIEAGYSVVYYKTDTKYHHNCQKRPRTFIFFFQHKDGKPFIPELKYEHNTLSIQEYFDELVKLPNDPMDVRLDAVNNVDIPLAYLNYRFGANWRESEHGDLFDWITQDEKETETFFAWVKENYDEKTYAWFDKYVKHILDKRADGMGYWSVMAKYFNNDCLPACMYKNVPITIHHNEDRLYTMREWFHTMGHPNDFNMIGEPWNYFRKMGQNVPVNTAKWVVLEAARIIENWDNEPNVALNGVEQDMFDQNEIVVPNVAFYDNAKMKRVW